MMILPVQEPGPFSDLAPMPDDAVTHTDLERKLLDTCLLSGHRKPSSKGKTYYNLACLLTDRAVVVLPF